MTTRSLLIAARERIADPANHCRGALARNARGEAVLAHSDSATSWCAYGATLAIAGFDETGRARVALITAAREHFNLAPETVNDTLGHQAVMDLYAVAIEAS